ncbi:EndoU domain-containing protein [Streptomyces sp. KHY 26]|uniref:EndoU domain-containing protein n=1 Tax=Streptomyces sp. KHY 26 TaxID=3097359 RepID=UPI00376EFE4B
MIEPGGIPQYTGDFGALSKAVTELRKHAIGIRNAGQDVHSRFQATAAFYKAPEADQLLSSTQPVMDTADEFAGHIESLADALDTFVGEAKPYADRLKHLKEKAIAFVDSVEGDDGWTKDQHKVDEHKALMDGVAEAVVGFQRAEHNAAVKIGAISPALCRPVGDEGGTYGISVGKLESMPDLPWGTPEGRTYDRWSMDWWGHGIKSWAWDGLVKDSLWGGFVGLGTFEDNILGINGSDAQHQTWDGLKRTVVGAYAYGMDAVGEGDHLSDWQRGSEAYAKEFGKQFIAYDEWHKDPARAHAVTSFNILTVFAGGGGALARLGKTGRFVEAAGTVAKVGSALDPISGAARAARALSDLPKVSEVLTNVSEHLRLPKTRFPDGALDDLSNRYRVDKDGNFIALKPDGTPDTSPVTHEPAAGDRVSPAGPGDREPVGVGGRAPEATSHASGHGALPGSSHGAAHAGGEAGHGAPTASHQPGHAGHSGSGTGTAPTTHHGASGGGHGFGHGSGGHGGYHGPAGSGTGHGGGGGLHHGQHGPQPPAPQPSGHIPEHTFEHVLKGELKYGKDGQPRVVGYHFRPDGRDPRGIKVPKILKIDHKTGLTQGNVWMRDPRTGTWVMKRAKTTFFPPTWTEHEVRRAMVKAFENSQVVDPELHMWRGEYKGITFEGYFDPVTGDAKTVYPIMP